MDAFDELAWIAANDVLNVEKSTPGRQDRAILAVAEQVLCMLSESSGRSVAAPSESVVGAIGAAEPCDVPSVR
jgi:hypothetical protein